MFFFFNDTATTEIYTLSLHDALPISPLFAVESPAGVAAWVAAAHAAGLFAALAGGLCGPDLARARSLGADVVGVRGAACVGGRSEEHTSELQSQSNLVCRLLLVKKKTDHAMTRTTAYADRHA